MTVLILVDVLLTLGATMRLTRLIVADDLGLWWVRGPAALWAQTNDTRWGEYQPRWRSKLAYGLACPFCVGMWIGSLVLLSLWVAGGPGAAWEPWRWVTGALTLNQISAHIGVRLGDTPED